MGDLETNWQNLPELCLSIVLDKLEAPSNLVQFAVVCKYWHSVFKSFIRDSKNKGSWSNCRVPMLLIPHGKIKNKRNLYSLEHNKEVSHVKLPKPYSKRCCGSCYGWLATVTNNMVKTLSNPFNNVPNIDLPKIELAERKAVGYQYDIQKVVLSADPSLGSFVVGVIYFVYCRLAFHKSGQNDWIYTDNNLTLITDIIFHRSLVYVTGHRNNVLSFDIDDSDSSKLKTLIQEDASEAYSDRAYLVESSKGNLYSIHRRMRPEEEDLTKSFQVLKLILDENGDLLEKKEVKSIDGDVVFVGDNGTLAVSTKYFPQGQPNSMYYTDDYFDVCPYVPFGPRDVGVFNLDDRSFGEHYQFQPEHKRLAPYIWILPPIHYLLQLDRRLHKLIHIAFCSGFQPFFSLKFYLLLFNNCFKGIDMYTTQV